MSTDKASGQISSSLKPDQTGQAPAQSTPRKPIRRLLDEIPVASDTTSSGIPSPGSPSEEQKPSAKAASSEGSTLASEDDPLLKPRQVIAVSASRGPAAFFNLARKFLVTDEMCDLSALEGAIVSAVDAAHLLERSKLATIVRVHTSYVTVEPKRRKHQQGGPPGQGESSAPAAAPAPSDPIAAQATKQGPPPRQRGSAAAGGRELRRARIVITVKRTESYERWLQENPLQAIIAGNGDEEEEPSSAEPR